MGWHHAVDIRKAVYSFCEGKSIAHFFNKKKEIAGKHCFKLFMNRHPELSVRVPESTSIQRAIGFNKAKVDVLFRKLHEIMFSSDDSIQNSPPNNIFNADETGFALCHRPHKVITKKGKRSVGTEKRGKGKECNIVEYQPQDNIYHHFSYFRVRKLNNH